MKTEQKLALEITPFPIKHSKLTRIGESAYKSDCPFCEDGILLVRRDDNGNIMNDDRCTSCCRAVVYTDLESN